jgi:transposase
MYTCIVDADGRKLYHKNIRTRPELFLKVIEPYREGLVVGVETIFCWYWLADLCADEGIPFVLGHAYYLKAIHGAKVKNDRVDSEKLAYLLRGGNFPIAYVYPPELRATRDLLRRRMFLVNKRSGLLGHIKITNYQYNLPKISESLSYQKNRSGFSDRFEDPSVRANVQLDLDTIDFLDDKLRQVETHILNHARKHNPLMFYLLRTIPGVGEILALVIMYEINVIGRFPKVQDFLSYSRLVKCTHTSNNQIKGTGGAKMGNHYLKWAFSEAAVLFLNHAPGGQEYFAKLQKKHAKGKALTILAQKLGRAVYFMLKRKEAFDMQRLLAN